MEDAEESVQVNVSFITRVHPHASLCSMWQGDFLRAGLGPGGAYTPVALSHSMQSRRCRLSLLLHQTHACGRWEPASQKQVRCALQAAQERAALRWPGLL